MCGIFGYIGKPVDQKSTFDLANALFIESETRGIDASGFWGCSGDKIFFHKEAVKGSDFVYRSIWQKTKTQNFDLLLGHCRYTSFGIGSERVNINNHPHVSEDCRTALIHNGKIPEYNYLKNHYPLESDCDSEVILRIFESGEDFSEQHDFLKEQLPKAKTKLSPLHKIYGINKIFKEIKYGAMAVAIGEYLDNNERSLWLFRNDARTLCLIDLRETMGQIFFCSTPEIFRAAVDAAKIPNSLIPDKQPVIKLPVDRVYHFNMKDNVISWEKLKVFLLKKDRLFDDKNVQKNKRTQKSQVQIVTQEVARTHEPAINYFEEQEHYNEESMKKINALCSEGISLLNSIRMQTFNAIRQFNIDSDNLDLIVDSLEDIIADAKKTEYMVR